MNNDMSMPADFNTLLLRLYRLSEELPIQHFQDAVLTQIKQVLPFDSSMWGTATTTPEGIAIHTVHLHEKSPDMLLAYEPLKHQDSAAATVFGKSHVTRTFHAQSWFSDPGTRELRDFLRRFEHENIFIAADSNPQTNFVHWISLYRADKEAHCTEGERLLLAQLAPHVMQALAFNRVMHLGHLEAADKAMSPHGSAIADMHGVLYHSNAQFKDLVQAEWNDWSGPLLPAVLMDALSSGHERFMGQTIVVRQYVEHGLLFLKARSRCLADLLTLREWTIARLIAKGESHKEIAQALNRSPATVRNQIQVIYEKLQIGNIAMLIEALRRAE
ncbi:regulatory protein, luxR family [Polaromonas sp. OV174]|uniref:helix-turn-helix transcriptional regulator n=1 Tax=Polaromonas sp. OV174 TaxID=1855300 RepID=UPI0008E11E57|nr:LuxR C-terminal-related transcriptional regulator [Polaromonas sp. OV174]SFB72662.1 regulatory protein, luxR family [Polaromonas sp. OV174]